MIVMKFGGSSVESAAAIRRVAGIVRERAHLHPVVVVSAMGKTTDRLLGILKLTSEGNLAGAAAEVERLRAFHLRESAGVEREIAALFSALEQVLLFAGNRIAAPRIVDAVASFGERLSGVIVAEALRRQGLDAVHLDARQVIVTDAHYTEAKPLFVETNARLRRSISARRITVMGGFIGATEEGVTTTLGRGGSDYTAAIVGAALSCDEIQIWTDVDGMLTCDPRLVPEAHCLRRISFGEAAQMAKSGAKVLHPATVAPAVRQRVPIVILNSRNPAAPGTRIEGESPCDGEVLSIACRKDVALLRLRPRNAPVTPDFAREVWDEFERAQVGFELVGTSGKGMFLAVAESALTEGFCARLREAGEVRIERGQAMVSLIGQNAARNAANLARASRQLCGVEGGAMMVVISDSAFGFLIRGGALERAAGALHEEFFGDGVREHLVPNRAFVREMGTRRNYRSLMNSSTVSPDSRISTRKVPFASSR